MYDILLILVIAIFGSIIINHYKKKSKSVRQLDETLRAKEPIVNRALLIFCFIIAIIVIVFMIIITFYGG